MATRQIFVGDSFPAPELQITDETFNNTAGTVLNLTSASAIEVYFMGSTFQFSQAGTPIWPATTDPDGTNFWNLSVPITTSQTAEADVYAIYTVVTWSAGQIETFPSGDTLTISTRTAP